MKKVTLGKTSLKVSRVGLGSVRSDEALMRKAWILGNESAKK